MLRVNQAMQHERVERKQRARHYDARIGVGVTIANPPLPPGTHTQKTVVFAAAPDGVCILQPERRGIGSRRQVDINVGLHGSPFVNQADRSLEVAIKCCAGKGSVDVSSSIDLKLIDIEFSYEVQCSLPEQRVILGAGKREAAFVGFKTLLLAIFQPLVSRVPVSAPGRKPDSGSSAGLRSCFFHRRETVGKAGMKMPQMPFVVPPVVKQEGVYLHTALFHQTVAKSANRTHRIRLVIFRVIANVIPGVVMQERSIRMCALTFEIAKEPAAQLSRKSNSNHGGISNSLPGSQRQLAPDLRDRAIPRSSAFGERVLKSKKEVSSNNRRSLDRTVYANAGVGHVHESNAADRQIFADRTEHCFLAHIGGTIAQNGAPRNLQSLSGIAQSDLNLPPAEPGSELRCVWIGFELFHAGRSDQAHLR